MPQSGRYSLNRENADGHTVLQVAILKKNMFCIKLLLTQDNIDLTGGLHMAMQNNNAEIVQLLLQHPNIIKSIHAKDSSGKTPLQIGLTSGCIAACKVLLADERLTDFTSVNDAGRTSFHSLVEKDENLELLPIFFKKFKVTKELFNKKDRYGYSPYALAKSLGMHQIAKMLLHDERMDLMSTDSDGYPLLHGAVRKHDLETVQFLIKKEEVDINAQISSSQKTPLHIAAEHFFYNPEVFFALFHDPRVDLNIQTEDKNTPFHTLLLNTGKFLTTKEIEKKLYRMLNDPRVDIDIQNNKPLSLLGLAIKKDMMVIFKLLLDRLKAENKPLSIGEDETIPDPETDLDAFLSHPSMEKSPLITAFYAALSVLKDNPNFTSYKKIFEAFEGKGLNKHPTWSTGSQETASQCACQKINELRADLFALTVFFCDGFLAPKQIDGLSETEVEKILNPTRFFRIMEKLPIELQMIVCNRAYGNPKQSILDKDSGPAFDRVAFKLSI